MLLNFPKRPETIEITPVEYEGVPNAPVFIFRAPTSVEEARIKISSVDMVSVDPVVMAEMRKGNAGTTAELIQELLMSGEAVTNPRFADYVCGLFDEYVTGARGVTIDDEPFDASCADHLEGVSGAIKLELGQRGIIHPMHQPLSSAEVGNSSSPSSSQEPTETTKDTDDAEAADGAL